MCAAAQAVRGPLRAPLCAGFAYGASNSNACLPGFSKIVLEAVCVVAAGAVGMTYRSIFTSASAPSGCLVDYGSGIGLVVDFNANPTGYNGQSLCAGAAAT